MSDEDLWNLRMSIWNETMHEVQSHLLDAESHMEFLNNDFDTTKDRDLAVALTTLQTAMMWFNRYVYRGKLNREKITPAPATTDDDGDLING